MRPKKDEALVTNTTAHTHRHHVDRRLVLGRNDKVIDAERVRQHLALVYLPPRTQHAPHRQKLEVERTALARAAQVDDEADKHE